MILGGNIIHELKIKRKKFTLGSSKYYFYIYYNFNKNQDIELPKNLILTIYILDSKKNSILELNKKKIFVKKNTFFYLKKYNKFKMISGSIKLLRIEVEKIFSLCLYCSFPFIPRFIFNSFFSK